MVRMSSMDDVWSQQNRDSKDKYYMLNCLAQLWKKINWKLSLCYVCVMKCLVYLKTWIKCWCIHGKKVWQLSVGMWENLCIYIGNEWIWYKVSLCWSRMYTVMWSFACRGLTLIKKINWNNIIFSRNGYIVGILLTNDFRDFKNRFPSLIEFIFLVYECEDVNYWLHSFIL